MGAPYNRGGGRPKGTPKTGGRKKGSTNKMPSNLKDAIIEAAVQAGGEDGMIGYLRHCAMTVPGPYLGLLGKVLPNEVTGSGGGPVKVSIAWDD